MRSCIRSGISRATNGVHSAVVLHVLALFYFVVVVVCLNLGYLFRQISLGVFWSTGQQLQPWFPAIWSSSASTVPKALQLSHNEVFPPT